MNCIRSLAYSMAVVAAFLEPPITMAHNLYLPIFNTLNAILCPLPISPKTASFETFTFSKNTCRVLEPLMPNFSSSAPSVMPAVFASTIKAVNLSPSTCAKTISTSAKPDRWR